MVGFWGTQLLTCLVAAVKSGILYIKYHFLMCHDLKGLGKNYLYLYLAGNILKKDSLLGERNPIYLLSGTENP